MTVDVLFITCNRRGYVEKTLPRLLENHEDFRIFWWDNGSTDGTIDFVRSHNDPRLDHKFLSPVNVKQALPTAWFLKLSQSKLVAKVDDDTLMPKGWVRQITPLFDEESRLGMIGCWTYWPSDYERNQADITKSIQAIGSRQIIRDTSIGGSGFIMPRDLALRYLVEGDGTAFPINRSKLTLDGYICGWYLPLLWAEHMDDPRSQYCLMSSLTEEQQAQTAQCRRIQSADEYLQWILNDVDTRFKKSFETKFRSLRRKDFVNRATRKINYLLQDFV